MKRIFLASLLISLLAIGSAWGATFTMNKDALLLLWEVYANPIDPGVTNLLKVTDNPAIYGQPTMSGVVGYVGTLTDTTTNPWSPFAQMQIGANFWGSSSATGDTGASTSTVIGTALGTPPTNSLVGYDKYSLYLENDNDDDWWVNLYLNTGYTDAPWNEPNNYYENTWTKLGPHSSVTLTLDLTGVANLNHITNIGFNVGGNMGTGVGKDPSYTDTFHVSAAPIPEPSTIILLGVGLFGLGAYGWHRRKKD
jgi:hypothetical protein